MSKILHTKKNKTGSENRVENRLIYRNQFYQQIDLMKVVLYFGDYHC